MHYEFCFSPIRIWRQMRWHQWGWPGCTHQTDCGPDLAFVVRGMDDATEFLCQLVPHLKTLTRQMTRCSLYVRKFVWLCVTNCVLSPGVADCDKLNPQLQRKLFLCSLLYHAGLGDGPCHQRWVSGVSWPGWWPHDVRFADDTPVGLVGGNGLTSNSASHRIRHFQHILLCKL